MYVHCHTVYTCRRGVQSELPVLARRQDGPVMRAKVTQRPPLAPRPAPGDVGTRRTPQWRLAGPRGTRSDVYGSRVLACRAMGVCPRRNSARSFAGLARADASGRVASHGVAKMAKEVSCWCAASLHRHGNGVAALDGVGQLRTGMTDLRYLYH